MPKKMLTKDELKEKVSNRVNEIIEKYSFTAERGINEIEKELNLLSLQADDTTIEADERMLKLMISSVILSCYAYEVEKDHKK